MATDVFVDTAGFYALLAPDDDRHRQAVVFLRQAADRKRRLVTTDYVLDETATLLQSRGLPALVAPLFDRVFGSRSCYVHWMDAEHFERTRAMFVAHLARGWSFTDCASFVVMRELHLREALTQDAHFREAGFVALLA